MFAAIQTGSSSSGVGVISPSLGEADGSDVSDSPGDALLPSCGEDSVPELVGVTAGEGVGGVGEEETATGLGDVEDEDDGVGTGLEDIEAEDDGVGMLVVVVLHASSIPVTSGQMRMASHDAQKSMDSSSIFTHTSPGMVQSLEDMHFEKPSP